MIQRSAVALAILATVSLALSQAPTHASAPDVVLYASDASVLRGHWSRTSSSGTAGGQKLASTDAGWSQPDNPLTSPSHYFEATFDAPSGTDYRVWLRLRATNNSKWNDSVWVQFSDATLSNGSAVYRIGSGSGLLVNLERCRGCGTSEWGWFNSAYWLNQATTIRFASSGTHTIRVQTREDGVEVDQIVLSPANFLKNAPGEPVNDTRVVSKPAPTPAPAPAPAPAPTPSTGGSTPYGGTPAALPGIVYARNFDEGGPGKAYYDTTSGNAGGAYRTGDVDMENSSLGTPNVGWTAGGEWLKYTVSVASAGTYKIHIRVAAPGDGARVTVAFDQSQVSKTLDVPRTGGWQSWRDVAFSAPLAAGTQVMTVTFENGGVNLHRIGAEAEGGSSTPSAPSGGKDTSNDSDKDKDKNAGSGTGSDTTTGSGGRFRMMTWNVQHGRNRSGGYDLVRQAQFMASQGADVIVLQEVQTWDEDQPARYRALLEQYTGQSWHVQWAPVINKKATEGNVVLTRLPVLASSYYQMHATGDWSAMYSNRSAAHTTVSVGGVPVHVFSTHLDWYNTSHRTAQLLDMMAWTEKFGGRRIVGGDFNSWWGEYWITTMMSDYYDTWLDLTGSKQNGHTVNDAVRFDYLFRSKHDGDKVKPEKVSVPSTSLSDHYPVVADYVVKP